MYIIVFFLSFVCAFSSLYEGIKYHIFANDGERNGFGVEKKFCKQRIRVQNKTRQLKMNTNQRLLGVFVFVAVVVVVAVVTFLLASLFL